MPILFRIQRRILGRTLRTVPAAAFRRLKRAVEAEALRRVARALFGAESAVPVATGPFAGLILKNDPRSLLLPKVLGSYEQELHPALEDLLRRPYTRVVNVGCAEGYYAVGLARRLPGAQVLAADIAATARAHCAALAALNGVGDRVATVEAVAPAESGGERSLWVVDCEGCEQEVLAAVPAERFARADLIVECHDFAVPGISDRLRAHFAATHVVETVVQGGRDPNAIPALAPYPEATRWLAVCEFRPEPMQWLVLRARA